MAVYEGLSTIAQAYVNQGLAANFWQREPKLWLLAALGGDMPKGPQGLDIGRPSGARVFSGKKLTKAERMQITNGSVRPRFAIANPTNVTILGYKDTAAQLSSWTSPGATQGDMWGQAEIKWTGLFDEEILIPREVYDRALTDAGGSIENRGLARERIVRDAVNMAKQNVLTKLATELQSGNPTDQDADPMDHLIGWSVWFSASNYCAGVDRSVTKNAQWCAQVDTASIAPSATALVDAANLTYHLQDLTEEGTVALFVNAKQFLAMKAELLGLGFTQFSNSVPEMAAAGAKNIFCLQKDNVYIVYDRSVPANTAYAITPSTWFFATHPQYTFSVSPFKNLWEYSRGAPQVMIAKCNLRGMLGCWNPYLNVVFTNVQDPS